MTLHTRTTRVPSVFWNDLIRDLSLINSWVHWGVFEFLNIHALTSSTCLLCVRGRCDGQDLRRKKHVGAGPCDDQTDDAQAGAADGPQLAAGRYESNQFIYFYLFEMLFYMKTLYMVCALLLLHTAPPLQCLDLWGNMFFIMQRNGQRWELPPTPRIWLVTPGATPPQTPPHQNHVRGHQERLLYVQKHGLEGFICNASFIWVWGVSKLRKPLHIILHLWVITTLSPVQQVCTSSRMWLNLN